MWPPPLRGEAAARFTLPLPPSTNNLYVPRRDGKGRAKTSEYIRWQRLAAAEIGVQKFRHIEGVGVMPIQQIHGPVAVLIEAGFSRKRDLDNIKPVLDLLVPATAKRPHGMGVIDDDRWIDDLRVVRAPGTTLTVSIWKI